MNSTPYRPPNAVWDPSKIKVWRIAWRIEGMESEENPLGHHTPPYGLLVVLADELANDPRMLDYAIEDFATKMALTIHELRAGRTP